MSENSAIDSVNKGGRGTGKLAVRIFYCVSLLVAAAYVYAFWAPLLWCTPLELYSLVYRDTLRYYYDQSKLADFGKYQHFYDAKIKTHADARKYANLMLDTLGDQFTEVFDANTLSRQADARKGFHAGVGMIMDTKVKPVRVEKTMENSPARAAGIRAGDRILSVDGMDTSGMSSVAIADYTRQHVNQPIKFLLSRGDAHMEIMITPQHINLPSIKSKVLEGGSGYLRVTSFIAEDVAEKIEQEIRDMPGIKALIVDLRDNPGGSVDNCITSASVFVDKGRLLELKTRVDRNNIQCLTYNLEPTVITLVTTDQESGRELGRQRLRRREQVFNNKPLYVLINKDTASAAEILAGILRDDAGAILVGNRSFGKGIAQQIVPLPQGMGFSITSGRFFLPSGQWIGDGSKIKEGITRVDNKRGLAPQIVIEPAKDMEVGESSDNQLAELLAQIKEKSNR